MAKIDLTSPEWCELIFQGKNKAYGAYKMRANSPKRHTWAMVIVVIIAAMGFSIPTLVNWQPEAERGDDRGDYLVTTGRTRSETGRVQESGTGGSASRSEKLYQIYSSCHQKDEEVRDDEEIKSQEELTQTKVAISIADVKGNDELNGKDIAELKEVITKAPEEENHILW